MTASQLAVQLIKVILSISLFYHKPYSSVNVKLFHELAQLVIVSVLKARPATGL